MIEKINKEIVDTWYPIIDKMNEIIDYINEHNVDELSERRGELWYGNKPLTSYGYNEVYRICKELYQKAKDIK